MLAGRCGGIDTGEKARRARTALRQTGDVKPRIGRI